MDRRSAEGGPDICHRDEDTVRIVGIAEGLEPEIGVKPGATLEMIVFQHIEHDGGCPHLFGNAEAAPHRIDDEGRAEPLALHVPVHGDGTNVDHRDVRHTGALPLRRTKIGPDGQCAKGVDCLLYTSDAADE